MKHTVCSSLVLFLSLSAGGCKTGVIGAEACRKVEVARCEAASGCELIGSLSECKRFAHDNCLHGFAANTDPRPSDADNCVDALHAASECVAAHGNVPPSKCKDERLLESQAATVCDFVISPELTPQCAFVVPAVEEPKSKTKTTPAAEPETPEEEEEEENVPDASAESVADAVSE
jgi:hypothetical protein